MVELVLGGAQLGLNYGATNSKGEMTSKDVENLLTDYVDSGFKYIDTSSEYGSSEKRIASFTQSLEINTKLKYVDLREDKKNIINDVRCSFYSSLSDLNVDFVNALFIHQVDVIKSDIIDLYIKFMIEEKERNRIKKIGVSIYEEKDMEWLEDYHDVIDIIQIPVNIFNQGVYLGVKALCHEYNIEIQARSVFLQGILLDYKHSKVIIPSDIREKLIYFDRYCVDQEIDKYSFSLDYVRGLDVGSIVIGVTDIEQWQQLKTCWEKDLIDHDFSIFKIENHAWLNPSTWVKK